MRTFLRVGLCMGLTLLMGGCAKDAPHVSDDYPGYTNYTVGYAGYGSYNAYNSYAPNYWGPRQFYTTYENIQSPVVHAGAPAAP